MSSFKRVVASAAALALATGTALVGAGVASAQDDEQTTGSVGSSSLGNIAGDLQTAADALTGPVTVTPNVESGPTVSFTNEGEVELSCLGFTAPYSTIVENDIDTDIDPEHQFTAVGIISEIDHGGNTSILIADDNGEPAAQKSQPASGGIDAVSIAYDLLFAPVPGEFDLAVNVDAGDEIAWTAPAPDTPALAAVICLPATGGDLEVNLGIGEQVVVDQINGTIPGGSVTDGSVSGGSVATGATALGSLDSIGGDVDVDDELEAEA